MKNGIYITHSNINKIWNEFKEYINEKFKEKDTPCFNEDPYGEEEFKNFVFVYSNNGIDEKYKLSFNTKYNLLHCPLVYPENNDYFEIAENPMEKQLIIFRYVIKNYFDEFCFNKNIKLQLWYADKLEYDNFQ